MDFDSIELFIRQRGFMPEKGKRIENAPIAADLYGFREGHSMWKLFPYEDHFFFYNLNDSSINNQETLLACHAAERDWVDKRFKYPKWMRYKVPGIITVMLSENGFSHEMKNAVSKHAPYGVGGEKHAMYLIDTTEKKLYSAGIEETSSTAVVGGAAASVKIAPSNINPVNRAYHLITDMMNEVL